MSKPLHYNILSIALLLTLFCGLALAELDTTPAKQVEFFRDWSYAPMPKWQHGFVVGFDVNPDNAPPVFAYDKEGKSLFDIRLSLAGAARVMVSDVAVAPQGVFAVSGGVYSGSGAAASFIAWLDHEGKILRVVRPTERGVVRICFSEDGTLWTAGRVSLPPHAREQPDHDIIRAYSPDGVLRHSLLPLSSFGAISRRHPVKRCHLVANQDQVLFYSQEFGEWIGISTAGEILFRERVNLPDPRMHMVTGFVLTPDAEIYIGGQVKQDRGNQTATFARWDRSSKQWQTLLANESRPIPTLFGYEEGRLIISREMPKFEWFGVH